MGDGTARLPHPQLLYVWQPHLLRMCPPANTCHGPTLVLSSPAAWLSAPFAPCREEQTERAREALNRAVVQTYAGTQGRAEQGWAGLAGRWQVVRKYIWLLEQCSLTHASLEHSVLRATWLAGAARQAGGPPYRSTPSTSTS